MEHSDGTRPAHVVGEQDVGVDPDVVAGLNPGLPAGPGEDGFGKGHNGWRGTGLCHAGGNCRNGILWARITLRHAAPTNFYLRDYRALL